MRTCDTGPSELKMQCNKPLYSGHDLRFQNTTSLYVHTQLIQNKTFWTSKGG